MGKTTLRSAAGVLTLISVIWQIFILLFLAIATIGLGLIIAVPLIILILTARKRSLAGSRGWSIYGIVQGIFLGDIFGIIGYACAIMEIANKESFLQKSKEEESPYHNVNTEKKTYSEPIDVDYSMNDSQSDMEKMREIDELKMKIEKLRLEKELNDLSK